MGGALISLWKLKGEEKRADGGCYLQHGKPSPCWSWRSALLPCATECCSTPVGRGRRGCACPADRTGRMIRASRGGRTNGSVYLDLARCRSNRPGGYWVHSDHYHRRGRIRIGRRWRVGLVPMNIASWRTGLRRYTFWNGFQLQGCAHVGAEWPMGNRSRKNGAHGIQNHLPGTLMSRAKTSYAYGDTTSNCGCWRPRP